MKNQTYRFTSNLKHNKIKEIFPEFPEKPMSNTIEFNSGYITGKTYGDGDKKIQLNFHPKSSIKTTLIYSTFYGTISDHSDGTTIEGCFKINTLMRFMIWAYITAAILVAVLLLSAILFDNDVVIIHLLIMTGIFSFIFVIDLILFKISDPKRISSILGFIEKDLQASPHNGNEK